MNRDAQSTSAKSRCTAPSQFQRSLVVFWLVVFGRALTAGRLTVVFSVVVLSVVGPQALQAAEAEWDTSPYDIRVWIAYEEVPELVQAWQAEMPIAIGNLAELTCGAAWQTQVDEAPASIRQMLLRNIAHVPSEVIRAADAEVVVADKLFLVTVQLSGGQTIVQVREYDIRTEFLGPMVRHAVSQPQRVAEQIAEGVMEAFAPLGLVSRVRDDQVWVRMRAGLLSVHDNAPTMLPPDGIMRPILRKNDRLGQPIPDGVEAIPWTLLQVKQRQSGTLQCDMISGLRSPMRSRSSKRIERLALAVRPYFSETRLRLHALNDPSENLAGYDVYFRVPDEKNSTFVGRSDWQGQLTVAQDEHPIKLLYVKHGGRLLARLPIVPGYAEQLDAGIVDDSIRLEAEGFLTGLQEQVVDLVARRKVLSLRIRKRLDEEQLEEADKLMDQLRSLPTREELDRRMRERQQALTSNNRAIQDKIDRMFRETKSILQKHLDPAEIEELRAELDAGLRNKRGGG